MSTDSLVGEHAARRGRPPGTSARALEVIATTPAARLLEGYRGGAPGDVQALARAMVGLGLLARDLSDVVAEADINPLMVLPAGRGVVALDGLIVLQPPS